MTIEHVWMSVASAIVVASGLGLAAATGAGGGDAPQPALDRFRDRVDAYVVVHRRAERTVPRLEVTDDPAAIAHASAALAGAIRAARPEARQGDVFTADASSEIRRRIRVALEGRDVDQILRDIYEEEDPADPAIQPRINRTFDGSPPPCAMPVVLLRVLPELPPELAYRLIDDSLVLLDTQATLIVDYLPDALPRARTTTR
jgi:hypothetical protein